MVSKKINQWCVFCDEDKNCIKLNIECKNPIPCEHKLHNTCKGFKIRIINRYHKIEIFGANELLDSFLIAQVNYRDIPKKSAMIIATNIIKTIFEEEVE